MARDLKHNPEVGHALDEAMVAVVRLRAQLAGQSSVDDKPEDPIAKALAATTNVEQAIVEARVVLGFRRLPFRLLKGGGEGKTDEAFHADAKAETARMLHAQRLDEIAILDAFGEVSENRYRQCDLFTLIDASGLRIEEAHAAINRLAVQGVVCLFNDFTEAEIEAPGFSGVAHGIRAAGGKWFHSAKLTSAGLVIAKAVWLSMTKRAADDEDLYPI